MYVEEYNFVFIRKIKMNAVNVTENPILDGSEKTLLDWLKTLLVRLKTLLDGSEMTTLLDRPKPLLDGSEMTIKTR